MKNLKPFDLNAALRGDPVVTREGEKVTHIAHFSSMPDRNVIWISSGEQQVNYTNINGRLHNNEDDSDFDLFMIPKKKKLWIGIGKRTKCDWYATTFAYESLEKLKQDISVSLDLLRIIQIEIEV